MASRRPNEGQYFILGLYPNMNDFLEITKKTTLLKRIFGQCGNFIIFPLFTKILREINMWGFYLEVQNRPCFKTHLEDLNLEFYEFLQFLIPEIYQIKKVMAKTAILEPLTSPKLISRKI